MGIQNGWFWGILFILEKRTNVFDYTIHFFSPLFSWYKTFTILAALMLSLEQMLSG
jgi:hypothetical protein